MRESHIRGKGGQLVWSICVTFKHVLTGQSGVPEMKLDTEFPKVDQEVKISCVGNVGRADEQPLYKLRLQGKWEVNIIFK